MRIDEARVVLGFPSSFHPTPSQVKEAYKRKVWQSHPDLFPNHEKSYAESRFKLVVAFSGNRLEEANSSVHAWTRPIEKIGRPGKAKRQISEAYTCLRSGVRRDCPDARYSRTQVVRTGVAMTHGGRRNHTLIGIPFLFITLGTVALGGSIATRAYNKQKQAFPSHNPFLP